MSNDPSINTALWNFCMKANDGPRTAPAEPLPPRDPKDLAWLKTVMESMEMPDKTMKRILKQVHRLDVDTTKKISESAAPARANAPKTAGGGGGALAVVGAAGASGGAVTTTTTTPTAEPKKKEKDDAKQDDQEENLSSEEIVKMLLNGPLDEMQELVEDLNFAKEFQLMKGPETVLYKLDGPSARGNPELREMLLLTIAHASQNLPDLQESFSQLEWARQLVPMLKEESHPGAAGANILACSSMCRGSAKASGEFVNAGGFDALFTVLSKNVALVDAEKKGEVDVKSCLRAIRLLEYFLQGKVSSSQVLEKVATFTLPLVENVQGGAGGIGEESLSQEDLRKTATDYMLTFFKLLGGVQDMQIQAKAICQQKILPELVAIGEDNWSPEQKELVKMIQ